MTKTKTSRSVRLSIMLCAIFAAACSILPEPQPVDVFLLPANIVPPSVEHEPRSWSLRLARPTAVGQLSSHRIVVLPEAHRVSVYKGVSWHASTPVLLRDRLFDAFRADGRISALSTDESRVFADFELASDLRAFHSEYRDGKHHADGGLPEIVIRLDARLIDAASHRIIASRDFTIRQGAHSGEIPDVITAFGLAGDRLADEIVGWAIDQADRARRGS
ncbi:MAG: ABC-type transport auxiliary lipoprotein family protein [Azoarcus sp.]|nr:ABC-type transport auxiliary lipoprotein family protein [Azoarcus sp.]